MFRVWSSVARSSRARTLRYYRPREVNKRVLEFFTLALKKRKKPARASRLIYLHVNNKQQMFNQQTAALTIILQQWLNYRTFLRTFDFKPFISLLSRLIFSKPRRSVIIINSYSYVLKINSQLVLKGIYVNALQTITLHLVGSRITFNVYFFQSTARNLVFQEIFEDEAQFFRY